jgi:hypothetical protein
MIMGEQNPHDAPKTFVHDIAVGSFSPVTPGFTPPPAREGDPHNTPYDDIGDSIVPVSGPVAPNIVGGALRAGPISGSRQ